MFPWDMTSNEQQHACMHLLLNQVFVVVKYLVYCNLLGQGGPVRFVVCQLTVGLTRKVRRYSRVAISLVFQINLFVGIGNLEVGGECTPHFFERGYCPPTDTFWIE